MFITSAFAQAASPAGDAFGPGERPEGEGRERVVDAYGRLPRRLS